jgi:uncharacterized membrane protein
MQRPSNPDIILTLGLAFVFGTFGIDKFLNPNDWLQWIPMWMEGLLSFPRTTWLSIIGFSEIVMALMILVPIRQIRQIGLVLMALHLLGILTQTGWNDVAVRDIGLLAAVIALLFLVRKE